MAGFLNEAPLAPIRRDCCWPTTHRYGPDAHDKRDGVKDDGSADSCDGNDGDVMIRVLRSSSGVDGGRVVRFLAGKDSSDDDDEVMMV